MSTALTKKTSQAVKGITSTVRHHLDAVERAREVYLAGIKRLEADYFDRIKKATAIITGEEEVTNSGTAVEVPAEAPAAEPPRPASP